MPFAAVVGGVIGLAGASMSADAQDNATQAQANTAAGQQALGQSQLDFNKQQYADSQAARDFALKNAQDVSGKQLDAMQFATDQAKSDQAYTEGTFRPLEKSLVSDAQGYDTPQRRADAAAAAQADVNQSFDANNAASERDLARSGIAPGSGKAMSIMQDARVAQAAAGAGAGTMASRNVEQQGYAREMDAASLGRNLPSAQATQQALGVNAGTASTTAGMQAVAAQQSGIPAVNAGYAGAISAGNSAGNLYGSAASGFGAINNSISSGIGSLGKAAGSANWGDVGSWMQSQTQPLTVDYGGASTNYTGGSLPTAGGWAKGGPVVFPKAAQPALIPSNVVQMPVSRSMPRMGGSPAAPANRGSYQAVPLSKGKAFAKGGMVKACNYVDGGAAVGGPPGTDTIPAYLDNGEHVVDAAAVTAIGGGSNPRGQRKLNAMRAVAHRHAA